MSHKQQQLVFLMLIWICVWDTGICQSKERKPCNTIYLSGDDNIAFPDDRGFYTLLNTPRNGRPAYIYDVSGSEPLYLYFDMYRDDGDGFWFVSSKMDSILTGTRAPDNASFPEDISISWQELYRNKEGNLDWKESPSIRARCVDSVPVGHPELGCVSGRLLVGSVIEHKHPIQIYTQGIYTIQEDIYNLRPVYKRRDRDFYIYYNQVVNNENNTESYWAISSEVGGVGSYALATVPSPDPAFIDGHWQVRSDTAGEYVKTSSYRSVCVPETMDICRSGVLELTMEGIPELNRLYIQATLGTYVLQDTLHHVRPVYKHTNGRYYIYYSYNEDINSGQWSIGKLLGGAVGIVMYVDDYAFRPEFITNNKWQYLFPLSISGGTPDYLETDGIKLRCQGSSSEDKCSDNLCKNGGTCLLTTSDDGTTNTTLCHCQQEYFGEFCQQKRVCDPPVATLTNGVLFEHKDLNFSTYPYLSHALYLCQANHTLQTGQYFSVCNSRGKWESVPVCQIEPSGVLLEDVYMSANGTDWPDCGNSTHHCQSLRYSLRRIKGTGKLYISGHIRNCGQQSIVEKDLAIYGIRDGFLDCGLAHKILTISQSIVKFYNIRIKGAEIYLHSSNDITIHSSKMENTFIQNYASVSDQLKFKLVNSVWESTIACTKDSPRTIFDLDDTVVPICECVSLLLLMPDMNSHLNVHISNSTLRDVAMSTGGKKNTKFKMEDSFVTSTDKLTRAFINVLITNGKSSVNITRTVFSGLLFEDFQGKESYTFASLVIREGNGRKDESFVDVTLLNNHFENNSRGVRIELSSQAKVTVINSSFVDNVGYGGGGGIWVTQGGFTKLGEALGGIFDDIFGISRKIKVDIYTSVFENNYAVNYGSVYPYMGRGGAVYADSKADITVFQCLFKNNTAELLGGAVFAGQDVMFVFGNSDVITSPTTRHSFLGEGLYIQGIMFISNVSLTGLKTNDDVPLLSYIKAGNPLTNFGYIKEIKVNCPESHKVLIRNVTSEARPTLHDHIHYSCVSCPEGLYSPFGGYYWSKADASYDVSFKFDPRYIVNYTTGGEDRTTVLSDVQCLPCPYGGYCKQGIHAKRNFWGYFNKDEISFEECQPEHGCQDEFCTHYNTCAPYRTGTLCSDCIEGYSQTFWGTKCVPNYHCDNLWIWGIVAFYGILYILFLVTEYEWKSFMHNQAQWFKQKMKKVMKKEVTPQAQTEHNERGLVRIFFYYVQIGLLLKLDILYQDGNSISDKTQRIERAFDELLNFNVAPLHKNMCVMPGWDSISKLISQAVFILYLYVVASVLYPLWRVLFKYIAPKLGNMSTFTQKYLTESDKKTRPTINIRFLVLFLELLLFTYQATADVSLTSLDCVDVGNRTVLSIKGNLECYQTWQYIMVVVIVVYVGPLFLVMLLGPKALLSNILPWPIFLISCIFPLLFAIMYPVLYYRAKTNDKKQNQSGTETNAVSKAIADKITGPYRYRYGLCWEGITTLQRLILAIISVLASDILVKHLLLSCSCLFILLLHIVVKPYKVASSNIIDVISLLFLSLLSLVSLVKSVLYKTGIVPKGELQSVLLGLEYLEVVFLLVIPLIIVVLVLLMCIVCISVWIVSACKNRNKYPEEKKKDDKALNDLKSGQCSEDEDDKGQNIQESKDNNSINNKGAKQNEGGDNKGTAQLNGKVTPSDVEHTNQTQSV